MKYLKFPVPFWALTLFIVACQAPEQPKEAASPEASPLDTLRLALDWRPNVLHSGIFWAQAQGYYAAEGLVLEWFTPEVDQYQKKPILRLLDGEVDLCIGPSEHLLNFAYQDRIRAVAVASLLQDDRSAFVAKSAAGSRPAHFAQAPYWGYHTPLERAIWTAMIRADGGLPDFEAQEPGRLSVWQNFLNDSAGVAWVFLHWEYLQAQRSDHDLVAFKPADYGVPYGYSSVLMAAAPLRAKEQGLLRRFLAATARGYAAVAAEEPMAVARFLGRELPHANFADTAFIAAAQADINPHYFGEEGKTWGQMDAQRWQDFRRWCAQSDSSLPFVPPDSLFYRLDLLGQE